MALAGNYVAFGLALQANDTTRTFHARNYKLASSVLVAAAGYKKKKGEASLTKAKTCYAISILNVSLRSASCFLGSKQIPEI